MHTVALKFIDAVERFGSIRAAARHLNVASSSITRQIQNVEHSFGVRLLERSKEGVSLTKAGEVVVAHIKRTLRDLERTKTQIEAIAGRRDKVLHLVTVDSVASSFLPILLSEYLEENPGIRFRVTVRQSNQVWQELGTLGADVAMNFLPVEPDTVQMVAGFPFKIGMSAARDHPLASRDSISLAQAVEYPVVTASVAAPVFDEVRELILAAKPDFVPWIETDSTSMIKNLIETGRFISLRTVLFSIGYDRSSLRTIWRPVAEGLPSETLYLATREAGANEARLFSDYAEKFINKSLHQHSGWDAED